LGDVHLKLGTAILQLGYINELHVKKLKTDECLLSHPSCPEKMNEAGLIKSVMDGLCK